MSAVFAPALPDLDIGFDVAVPAFSSVEEVVATIADDQPIHILYPQAIARAAAAFRAGFAGRAMYAVKCNPTPAVLALLARSGIRDFDVASIPEIESVRRIVPDARMYFMHPVKSRKAIRHAWLAGIRAFAVDCAAELDKILEETGGGRELEIFVRIALPAGDAALDLSRKFGVAGEEAVLLLRRARCVAGRLAVSFHVGSQCMNPDAYRRAVIAVRRLVDAAGVGIDLLDVGGGFPVAYPGMAPLPLAGFLAVIADAVAAEGFGDAKLLAEPGRALVAEGGSVLAMVELRKGDRLYLNDGTFGALYDAGALGWRYPVRVIRPGPQCEAPLAPFSFFGPTCDSMDVMTGPFLLPADVGEGDWIEIGHLGAYGAAMRTRFNGFFSDLTVAVDGTDFGASFVTPACARSSG